MSDTSNPGAAAPAAAPTATPAGGEPTAAEVFAFDPFGPKETSTPGQQEPGQSGEPGKPAEGEGQGQPGASATPQATPGEPKPSPATPPAQPSPQQQPSMQELVAAIRQAATPQQTPQGQQPSGQPEAPRYNLQLPPQIMTALRSEDPAEFATGMHSVVNGIANKLWSDVQEHFASAVMPQIVQSIQANMQQFQQQQAVAQAFYGKHKTLADAKLRPLVQQAGLAVIQARQASGKSLEWSDEVMDEIAEEVFKTVPQLRPAAPQAAAPNGKQPFATGQGARTPGAGQKTQADELAEFVKN